MQKRFLRTAHDSLGETSSVVDLVRVRGRKGNDLVTLQDLIREADAMLGAMLRKP